MAEYPNLLFIWTDEQRADTMAAYGNTFVQAPNLNALARESVVFENACCTQAVCTPSRSSVLTGLYPHTNGCVANNVPLSPAVPTMAEMLPEEYLCAYYGKWHLGDEVVLQHGFDEWLSIEDNYREDYSRPEYLALFSDYHHYLEAQGFEPHAESQGARVYSRRFAARLPEPHTKAAFLGRRAAEFIRLQDGGRPFMLHVNMLEPHMPFTGPFDDLYDPAAIPTGPHFLVPPAENASALHRLKAAHYRGSSYGGHDLGSEAGWRKLRAQYLSLVTLVDRAVGEILRALAESGLAENTIVVFTSDHGDMMGDHGILAKTVLYEESVGVPLLLRVPWVGPRRAPGRVSQVDLVPTLLDLLGVVAPTGLEGESRAGVVEGAETLADNDVVVEWNPRHWATGDPAAGDPAAGDPAAGDDRPDAEGNREGGVPWRSVVTADGWKLNLSPDDQCELYDLNGDPHELVNLYDAPEQQSRVTELAARIAGWQQLTRDTVPLPHIC